MKRLMDPQPPEDVTYYIGYWLRLYHFTKGSQIINHEAPADMPQARPVFDGGKWFWMDEGEEGN